MTAPGPSRPRFGRRESAVLAGALVVVLAVVALAVVGFPRTPSADPDAPGTSGSPTPSDSSGDPASTGSTGSTRSDSRVTRRDLGRVLLPSTAGYEIVGFGPRGLVRVRPDTGAVVVTSGGVGTTSTAQVTARQGYVLVGGPDQGADRLFPDGRPVRAATGVLEGSVSDLPGPDPVTVWSVARSSRSGSTRIGAVDPSRAAPTAEVPLPYGAQAEQVVGDGAGSLLLRGLAGWYRLEPDSTPYGLRRITTGELLAVGPTRWLTTDCDDAGRCATTVTDRTTGERRRLPGPVRAVVQFPGTISPDGRWAVLSTDDDSAVAQTLVLVDLSTGTTRPLALDHSGKVTSDQLVWTPDSRWLLALDHRRGLVAVDPATVRIRVVGAGVADLAGLVGVTVRPG